MWRFPSLHCSLLTFTHSGERGVPNPKDFCSPIWAHMDGLGIAHVPSKSLMMMLLCARCLGVVFPVPSDNPQPPPSSSLVCAHCWPGAGHGQ